MVHPYGLDPELWINHVNDLLSIDPRVIQDYTAKGIVAPKQAAIKQGGRNIYGRIELTKIIAAKVLVESGMSLNEVKNVMKWVEREEVHVSYLRGVFGQEPWRGGDPNPPKVEDWSGTTTYDPFPPSPVKYAHFGASREYPRPPMNDGSEWIHYWGSVMHLLPVHEFYKKKSMSQILIPRKWLSPQASPPQEFNDWLIQVTGGWTVDVVLKEMNSELTAIRFLDLALLKKRVAEAILSLPASKAENIKRVK